MDAIAGNVVQGLASSAHAEFKLLWNVKHDIERMKNTVLAIRASLLDAEEKANNNHHVSLWLARLKDVLYDADDLLDDLSTEALRRKIMTQNKVMAKKVRIFFSKSNQLVYNLKMAHKLREVEERLDEIDDDKKKFQLIDQPPKPFPVLEERKNTYSFVQVDEIIGREKEKDSILRSLLDSNVKSSVSIIPIVGFGGLGKTALAQLVYNHECVQDYFELRKWVCVSDEFDVRQIAQKISGREDQKEMEKVQQDVREFIEGKKFLIVLDDVWNEDVELWYKLKSLITKGAEGSMIIVTTRSEKVGKMMGTHMPVILKGLDGEKSWELFCRMAFVGGKEPNDKEFIAIGREIVKKCGGVPLAIRVVGSLVYEKTLEGITDLSYLRNCELWNVDKSLEKNVIAVLKLSYDHLLSPLKNCFDFCSLFPKDFLFNKQRLIQMWVAQGFTQSTSHTRSEEDVGNEYFMNLLSRSFFQDVMRDHCDNIVTCKMHDLIHDLAQFVAKHEYLVIREGNEERTRDTTRHLSFDVPKRNWEVPTSFLKFEKLRTLSLFTDESFAQMDGSVFCSLASKLKCLRVLKLNRSQIFKIPKDIGKLKHLRFLDLSYTGIQRVPKAITKLHNLQTLDLRSSSVLQLPRGISKLVSLRHLHLTDCLDLQWMPSGLGRLTGLQTLTDFVVADPEIKGRRASARISELGELNNLRGTLTISGLKRLRSNPEEAETARLKEKQHLQQLTLVWSAFSEDFSEVDSADELILERLRPHHTIKALFIKRFCGERLPDWIGNLRELQHLVLYECVHLISLPQGLCDLTSLRTLTTPGSSPLLDAYKCQNFAHLPALDGNSFYSLMESQADFIRSRFAHLQALDGNSFYSFFCIV